MAMVERQRKRAALLGWQNYFARNDLGQYGQVATL
jgi:hypothetical protein